MLSRQETEDAMSQCGCTPTRRRFTLKQHACSLSAFMTLPFMCLMIFLTVLIGPFTYLLTRRPFCDVLLAAHDTSVKTISLQQSQQAQRLFTVSVIYDIIMSTSKISVDEDGMVALLCSLIDNIDSTGHVRSISIASTTEMKYAVCTHADPYAPSLRQLDGSRTTNGMMSPFTHIVDRDNYYAWKQPLEPWSEVKTSLNSSEWLYVSKDEIHIMDVAESYWNGTIPYIPNDVYWGRRSSIKSVIILMYPLKFVNEARGFLQLRQGTSELISDFWSASSTDDRVINICPACVGDENPQVFDNNWGQATVNDTSAYGSIYTTTKLLYLHLSEISDPFMRKALKYVDVKSMDTVGYRKTIPFIHKGSPAFVTALRADTRHGMPLAIVYATPTPGGGLSRRDYEVIIFTSQAVLCVLLVLGFWLAMHMCYGRPLQDMTAALLQTSDVQRRRRRNGLITCGRVRRSAYISEVDLLIQTYNMTVSRLRLINTFIPQSYGVDSCSCSSAGQSISTMRTSLRNTAFDVFVTCVRVAMASTSTRKFCQGEDVPVASISTYLEAVYKLAGENKGLVGSIYNPGQCSIFFFRHTLSALHKHRVCDGPPEWREGTLLRTTQQDACNAMNFAFALQNTLDVLGKGMRQSRRCHIFVDSLNVTSGVSFGEHANQHVFVGKGERSVFDDLGYLLPKLQIPICITEETFRLVRESVRAIPLEAIYAGIPSLDEYGVVLYEALSGPVDDEAWLKYATHFCNAFGHMLRGDYESAIDEFDLIPSVPGLDVGFMPHAIRQSLGSDAESVTKQLDRLMNDCIDRVLMHDSSPCIRRPREPLALTPAAQRRNSNNNSAKPIDFAYSISAYPGAGAASVSKRSNHSSRNVNSEYRKKASSLRSYMTDQNGSLWYPSRERLKGYTDPLCLSAFQVLHTSGTLAMAKTYSFLIKEVIADDGLGLELRNRQLKDLFPSTLMSDHTVANLGYSLDVQDCVVFITEWYPGGTLRKMMSRYGRVLPTPTIIRYIVSILSGLQFLHSRRVVHGDVRPETVLVGTDGRCKLTGFFGDRRLAEHVLLLPTSCYMSPEVARGGAPSAASDVYCAGLVLVEMLTGGSPWRWSPTVEADRSPSQLDQLLSVGGSAFAAELCAGNVLVNIPEQKKLRDTEMLPFVEACFQTDPAERPSAREVLQSISSVLI